MFYVGCARGPDTSKFAGWLEPTLAVLLEQDPSVRVLVRDDNRSLASAYNAMLDTALAEPGCEGIFLVHDDIELLDPNLIARARRVFSDRQVAVAGVIGGVDVWQMRWWRGSRRVGVQNDTLTYNWFPPLRSEVDAVDGQLLLVSRAAIERFRFDEETFDGFHGYDVDFCTTARAGGMKVVVEPFRVFHHSQASGGGTPAIEHYAERFAAKWAGRIARQPRGRRWPRLGKLEARGQQFWESTDAARRDLGAGAASVGRRVRRLRGGGRPAGTIEDTAGPGSVSTTVRCPLCEDLRTFELLSGPLHQCPSCSVVVNLPLPTPRIEGHEFFDTWYRMGAHDEARNREARSRLTWLEQFTPDGCVLELGPGTGNFLRLAQDAGYEAIGVEPSEAASAELRRAGLLTETGTLQDWVARNHGFVCDAVVLFHVLEHLASPVEELRSLVASLRPGGVILIEVPNVESVVCGDTDALVEFNYTQFGEQTLRTALARAGFVDIAVEPISTRPYTDARGWGDRVRRGRLSGPRPAEYLRASARRPG